MKCKNCKEPFGLSLELGGDNENIGKCTICQKDVCASCGQSLGIETQMGVDPVVICLACISGLGEASKTAAA